MAQKIWNKFWLIGVGVVIVVVVLSSQIQVYRPCGHKQSLGEKYFPRFIYCATHCCRAGVLVSDLTSIYCAEQMYHEEMGRYSRNLADLEGLALISSTHIGRDYSLVLSGTSLSWQCAVFKNSDLPGHYLLTSDGYIYFSEDRAATTKDVVLHHF